MWAPTLSFAVVFVFSSKGNAGATAAFSIAKNHCVSIYASTHARASKKYAATITEPIDRCVKTGVELDRQMTNEESNLSRRSLLHGTLAAVVALVYATSASDASAVIIDAQLSKAGTIGTLTPTQAEERLRAGRESVTYLLKNYNEICDGGGDNVRRYLGTVGTTSGLFGIQKAMKVLSDRSDDIVEYTEVAQEVETTIQQADGSAYMAIFAMTSTSYVPPEKYFKEARIEVERCAKALDELAAMIGVKL